MSDAEPDQPSSAPPNFQIAVPDDQAGGVWANFAAVSHSPYEFTIDFARMDYAHPREDGSHQGTVVARVNLSPLMVTQLLEALNSNWQGYAARSMPPEAH
ncbi:DUF3467 domain-containing protein [uncultured Nocardioides sp.]|uniref:DUF3467 domain-containing protein n=1 Tax=uncultured Nocardioides sp. TaxID=198441 RepID=UPI0025FC6EDC|nr:DUF3467 domain-containing protein [uncultured Nocardioides sp.]